MASSYLGVESVIETCKDTERKRERIIKKYYYIINKGEKKRCREDIIGFGRLLLCVCVRRLQPLIYVG